MVAGRCRRIGLLVAVVAPGGAAADDRGPPTVAPDGQRRRLTRCPNMRGGPRCGSLSMVVALGVLTVLFGAAVWPAPGRAMASADFDATHPEDIMLCVGGARHRTGDGRIPRLLRSSGDER